MFWEIKKGSYRVYQTLMRLLASVLQFREPELLTGAGCLESLPGVVKSRGINNVLVVTDQGLMGLGMLDGLFRGLKEKDIKYYVYDQVQPNPTVDNIEAACRLYLDNNCQGFIAFGGGSPMDCAKMAAARAANNNLAVKDMRGTLKIKKSLPPLFAVPTTAGTGSETTIAAVVTDPKTHEKYAVMDLKLTPAVAVLDPQLTVGLPPHITATTGVDALTHAIEAYIGRNSNEYTNKQAEEAVKLIFQNLETAYKDGGNLEARNQMLIASYKAGNAFTRAYVGYVHAVAHTLGGLYGVPHGLANAVVLPYVLELYGASIYQPLARLATAAGIGNDLETEEQLAKGFIQKVKTMNQQMNIPLVIPEIQDQDIPLIVKRTLKEGNPTYPVPKIINEQQCTEIIKKLVLARS